MSVAARSGVARRFTPAFRPRLSEVTRPSAERTGAAEPIEPASWPLRAFQSARVADWPFQTLMAVAGPAYQLVPATRPWIAVAFGTEMARALATLTVRMLLRMSRASAATANTAVGWPVVAVVVLARVLFQMRALAPEATWTAWR